MLTHTHRLSPPHDAFDRNFSEVPVSVTLYEKSNENGTGLGEIKLLPSSTKLGNYASSCIWA